MSLVLNTNYSSLIAQQNLSTSGGQLSTALQQLSSGLRLNTAADDAAGYAIANGMTSQINGLHQAAQKSISNGKPAALAWRSKCAASRSIGCPENSGW